MGYAEVEGKINEIERNKEVLEALIDNKVFGV